MTVSFWTLLLQSFLIVALGLLIIYLGSPLFGFLRPRTTYSSLSQLEADYQNARIDVDRYLAEKERLRR